MRVVQSMLHYFFDRLRFRFLRRFFFRACALAECNPFVAPVGRGGSEDGGSEHAPCPDDDAELTFVYVLFTRTGEYVGKAIAGRKSGSGASGFASRCAEHLQAMRKPLSAEGRMGRHRDLRPTFGTIGFLPIASFAT